MECSVQFALELSTDHELLVGLADLSAPNILLERFALFIHKTQYILENLRLLKTISSSQLRVTSPYVLSLQLLPSSRGDTECGVCYRMLQILGAIVHFNDCFRSTDESKETRDTPSR